MGISSWDSDRKAVPSSRPETGIRSNNHIEVSEIVGIGEFYLRYTASIQFGNILE